jgi:ribosome biogenesis protein BRX1
MDVYGFAVKKAENWVNRQRTMVLSSRGVTAKGRYLMLDIFNLLPHSKREVRITFN